MFTKNIFFFRLFFRTKIYLRHSPLRRVCQADDYLRFTAKARGGGAEWVYPELQQVVSSVRRRNRRRWPRVVVFNNLPVFEYSSSLYLVLNYMQARLLPTPCPSVARRTHVRDIISHSFV